MNPLDALLVALQFRGCEPRKAGRSAWRSDCPLCRKPDAIGLGYRFGVGLSILPRCGCARAEILSSLGIEDQR